MENRTAQDLLAERRANIQELRGEKDPAARAMLQAHIGVLDRRLESTRIKRQPQRWAGFPVAS